MLVSPKTPSGLGGCRANHILASFIFAQIKCSSVGESRGGLAGADGVSAGPNSSDWLPWSRAQRANKLLNMTGADVTGDVVGLAEHREEADLQYLQATCANPKCDEQFLRAVGPGRRKDFHSEECRRTAEREHRRIASLLEHYNRQADQMRARMAAYLRTSGDVELNAAGPSAAELDRARVVVAEIRGMARFLQNHQEDFAQDLLRLLEAVEPLVHSPQVVSPR